MKALSRVMLAAAAASMTVLPVVAQAGTRAGDSGATYSVSSVSAVSAPGKGRKAEGESFLFGLGLVFSLFIVGGVVVAGAVLVDAVVDSGKTPGAR